MSRLRIDGVDLSHYQAGLVIDWPEAKKAGVKFVYHKATESTTWTDPSYPKRRAEAKKNGVLFGAYHFARPAVGNAESEAKAFLAYASPVRGDLAPALDLEVNDNHMSEDELSTWVATWFKSVFAHTGVERGVLYTHFNLTHKPKGVHLWASRYNNDNRPPVVPSPFLGWRIWQFSDGKFGNPSVVPGVGRVDIDTLRRFLGLTRLSGLTLPTVKPRHKTQPTPPVKETPIDRMVRIAKGQIGYHEGRSNGHWNNIQKFSPAVPGLEWSQGQPWCCTFVSWLAMKADLASLFPRTASCDTAAAWWKAHGQWHEYPAIGAQVLYGVPGNMEHTGFVVDYDDTYIWAVEGNTNNNGSAEGDGVYLKKRLRRDPYVQGYGYPDVLGGLKSADPNYQRSH